MRSQFIGVLYRLLGAIALPLLPVYFLWRGLRDRRYFHRLPERFGFPPYRRTAPGAIWLHAVSVGEAVSSVALVRRLREILPRAPLFISTTTLAGRAVAEEKLASLSDGIFFSPVDSAFAVRRVLRALRPSVVVILETEIWPNLYAEVKRTGAALLIVNGRISDRTIGRYKALRWLFEGVLALPDAILAQSERDRERYVAIGAPPGRVVAAGNLKYDFEPRGADVPEAIAAFLQARAGRPVWIAASTMPPAHDGDIDEDEAVIEAYRRLRSAEPELLLLLVPRRPERFDAVAAKLKAAGVVHARRSRLPDAPAEASVLLVDSMGELAGLFPVADVVFMGGSLARRGGHNILEPAFCSRAIVVGPNMQNFAAIAAEFEAAGAVETIAGPERLAGALQALLSDAARSRELGRRARAAAEARRGVTARAAAGIAAWHRRSVPALPPDVAAALFCGLWRIGGAVRSAIHLAGRKRLRTPVISVGNIAMGGTGKTPFVLWLASRLSARGSRPAILTRGYGRKSRRIALLGPGESAPLADTGEEARILSRAGVPVGIGAGRVQTGRLVEDRFRPDVLLLDDGFQHRRLARDIDIVLIDAMDPFAGGRLFPAGRLREPVSALARADILVITRAEPWLPLDAIEQCLRRINPRAPVYRARVAAAGWHGARISDFSAAGAFCGLGNPGSFFETLRTGGIVPRFQRAFPDHHRYRRQELEQMAREAPVLLTTEKDYINLPSPPWPADIAWLEITIEVDGESELLSQVDVQRLLEKRPR